MAQQGSSLNRAHEHIAQAMFLNIQHDLRALAPGALLFQGASFDKLGKSHHMVCNAKTFADV